MKGILLAGGSGTRLYPATLAICKQLLPVFDKPMIYYPLATLMLAGIREILIISTPDDTPRFQRLLGTGAELGLQLSYAVQEKPEGIAQALLIGASFIGDSPFALILGDNLFYGSDLANVLHKAGQITSGAHIFAYQVQDPARYGVISFDVMGRALTLEEKPLHPKSRYAVPGLYFYGPEAVEFARKLKPSPRGELEITDLSRLFLERGELTVTPLSRGHAWLDTGTFDALQKASAFVQALQERQGIKIGCLEEIAYHKGYITAAQLQRLASQYKNEYGDYLRTLVELRDKSRDRILGGYG